MKVMVIMGSESDDPKVEPVILALKARPDLEVEVAVLSAHRTPLELKAKVESCRADVFLAAAGMAAALPGVIAAYTDKPVIGLPLSGNNEADNEAAVSSMTRLPGGVSVRAAGLDDAVGAEKLVFGALADPDRLKKEEARKRARREKHDATLEANDRIRKKYAKIGG